MTKYSTNEPGGRILHAAPVMQARTRRVFLGFTRLLTCPEKNTGVNWKYVFLTHEYSIFCVPEPYPPAPQGDKPTPRPGDTGPRSSGPFLGCSTVTPQPKPPGTTPAAAIHTTHPLLRWMLVSPALRLNQYCH